MIVDKPKDFIAQLQRSAYGISGPACARSVMMVEPDNFYVNEESATDNRYMNITDTVDAQRALRQSQDLGELISKQGIEVIRFAGDPDTPDAIFPNNVFSSTKDRFIVGRMLHPVRQK